MEVHVKLIVRDGRHRRFKGAGGERDRKEAVEGLKVEG
jgi:hypothetical protein